MSKFIKIRIVDTPAEIYLNADFIVTMGEKPGDTEFSILDLVDNTKFNGNGDPLTVGTRFSEILDQLKIHS